MRKRVLVPSVLLGDAARVFEEGGVEVVYALPQELRDLGDPEQSEQRRAAYDAAMEDRLPEAHALSAIGLGAHLQVTAELLDSAPNLEVVFVPSAGTETIDVDAATERGIAVVNAAGNNYVSVAEHAVGLMLSLSRMIALCDRFAHREARSASALELGGRWPGILHGRTVGLLGFGFTGRELARICTTAFAMRALAYDPFFHPTEAERQGVELVDDLDRLLVESDFLSVHTPLTPETRHIVGSDELVKMKPTAYLVNTSRGGTIDTEALVHALRTKQIAGAGLDVSDPEPLPDGHPLFSIENVILTPHIAGAAPEMIARAGEMSAADTVRALTGARPRNLVNPEVWPAFDARLKGGLVGEAP